MGSIIPNLGRSSQFKQILNLPILGNIIPKMGMIGDLHAGLGGALFSQTRLRVLGLLIGHPDRDFYASEIIRLVHSGSGAVQRELENLTRAGIITATMSGNRKVYRANKQSPIFDELHGLVLKTIGLVDPIRDALKKFKPKIAFAFVYGSVAKGLDTAKSDIDLMIVGNDLTYGEVFNALQKTEHLVRRPINPNLMDIVEWERKCADANSFVAKILEQPKIFVLGTEDGLTGARQSR